jgi:glycyl-tRNA synthetase
MPDLMDKIIALAKNRGFIFPGSEIYGGLANSWDYGPLGAELKNNIKQRWWSRFVHGRDDMVGIDTALIMNPRVWEASGHLSNFSDPLVECRDCHSRFRMDDLENTKHQTPNTKKTPSGKHKKNTPILQFSNSPIQCPQCGSGNLTVPKQFNLMFKTFIGPAEESSSAAYLRPETAQGMFVNFANVLRVSRKRLPFGIAQVGRAFRNEITPGNFIFRTREFEQMEIEYFIRAEDWKKYFDMWLSEMRAWLTDLGINKKHVHDVEIPDGERAHYSKKTVDIEYNFPFGQKELYGLAYRTDFDLKNHLEKSGADLQYTDPDSGEKFIPHVIEPTWGVDRSVLAALLESYHEEEAPTAESSKTETRAVLKFPKWLAPVKVAVLPLSKKEELSELARKIYRGLLPSFACEYDATQSIGKRYRRQDEIGTPYCLTVDFESLNDNQATVRDRDTMKQERIAIEEVGEYLREKLM